MITTMNGIQDRENPKDSLLIFDNFVIDKNLSKFKSLSDDTTQDVQSSNSLLSEIPVASRFTNQLYTSTSSTNSTMIIHNGGFVTVGATQMPTFNQLDQYVKNGPIARFVRWISKRKEKIKQECEKKNVRYVFDSLLTNPEVLIKYDESNAAYDKMIANAKSCGQIALVEKLESEKQVRKFENALLANGFPHAVSEQQLITFSYKCEKGLRLDWVKNFTRTIPIDAIDKIKKVNDLYLFDNFVILYYDPENKACKLTKEEIEKKKDPILFGVMAGNRKLYFIHDWKDEMCDLTLRDIADQLGTTENLSLELPND